MSNRFKQSSFVILILLMLAGCVGTTPRQDKHPPVVEHSLTEICRRYNLEWVWDPTTQAITIDYRGIQVRGLAGSRVLIVNDEKVFLSRPLLRKDNTIAVPPDFEEKVIAPILAAAPKHTAGALRFKEIIVDAGHGGKDPGATGRNGVREKDVVLDIALRLRKNLEKKGIKVIMTRETDVFISLEERTIMTSKTKADLFVSVHANSSPSRKTKGMEVYFMRNLNARSALEERRIQNQQILFNHLQMASGLEVQRIVSDMLYIEKQSVSPELASYLVRDAARSVDAESRGSHSCGFFVLRNTLIPAILIEVGFLTHPGEEGLLNTAGYRQKLADAITESILKYAEE